MDFLDITLWDLMVIMLVGMITAFPLVKLSRNMGNNIGVAGLLLFSILPILQLIYLYFLAFQSTSKNGELSQSTKLTNEEKQKNADAWKAS